MGVRFSETVLFKTGKAIRKFHYPGLICGNQEVRITLNHPSVLDKGW